MKEWVGSRRSFIKTSAFGAGAITLWLATGCDNIRNAPTTENPTVNQLKALLEYKDEMTTADIAQLLFNKATRDNGSWMTNASLGVNRAYYGVPTDAKTDKFGEEITPTVLVGYYYPEPNTAITFKKELKYGNNTVIIYGTSGTISRLSSHEEIIKKFTEEYFRGTRPEQNYLVLNFFPIKNDVEISEINYVIKSQGQPNALTLTHKIPNNGQQDRIDIRAVIFNMQKIQAFAEMTGDTPQKGLIEAIGDEKANFLADDLITTDTNQPISEAPSTIAGLLAVNDPAFAAKLIGGTAYSDFSRIIAEEMLQLKGISKKSSASLSRRELLFGKFSRANLQPQFAGRRFLHIKKFATV